MKKFIYKLSIMMLIIICILTCISAQYKIIPFEASISFDSKVFELKKHNNIQFENIAIGSSMTLNNLSSNMLVENLSTTSFYNVSAWGQSLYQSYQILQVIVPLYKPQRIFMVTYPGDFVHKKYSSISDIKRYLSANNIFTELYLMTKYKLQTKYLDEDTEYASFAQRIHNYEYLGFDAYGGVSLDIVKETLNLVRWEAQSQFQYNKHSLGYEDLSKICEYLSSNDIEFIFIMSPSRSHCYENNLDDLQMHIACCDSIINNYDKQLFINEINFEIYNDTLFADHSHLNRLGSEMFTNNVFYKYYQLLQRSHDSLHIDSIGFLKK